jgi:hypothetical protein
LSKIIKVFIGSPGDVAEERDVASHVVGELNRILGDAFDITLSATRWETHAWPDVGEDAQDVINREIGEFDILVGVMWRRFGSPTKRAGSGTGEEFQRAYELFKKYGRPKIMFYFRTTPFYTTDLTEVAQFRKVLKFRADLEKLGVLYWEYGTPLEFERNVREHLMRQLLPAGSGARSEGKGEVAGPRVTLKAVKKPSVFFIYGHADADRVLTLRRVFEMTGFNTWLDQENLLPGQYWHLEVERALEKADMVLLFLSESTDVTEGQVGAEVKKALALQEHGKGPLLIPIRLDRVEPPAILGARLYVDLFARDGLESLLSVVRSHVEEKMESSG